MARNYFFFLPAFLVFFLAATMFTSVQVWGWMSQQKNISKKSVRCLVVVSVFVVKTKPADQI